MNRLIFVQDTILLVLYSLTSLLALIGNGIVYRVCLQRRNSIYSQSTSHLPLTTTSIFLLNLAIADALSGLTIPIQFIFCSKYFLEKFPCSSYLCLLTKSIEILGYNASTLTICVIAFDRYRLVNNPLQQYHRIKTRRALFFIWILPGLFSTSCLVSMKVNTYFNSYQQLISCEILFPLTTKYFSNDYIQKIRAFCLTFLFYIIPLFINTILCILTMRTIARRTIIGVSKFRTFEQSRTRSIRLLMVIVIVFALSHLPVHFINVRDFFISSSKVSNVRSTQANKCNYSTMYLLFYWLGSSSCCHNPIIYSWFNRQYRTIALNYYRSIVYCGRQQL
ncbi:unnamed protein product [Rotaria sp. Silwood1]|nr:unnamed protein product [Rotaria sp. Silwood1]CAF1084261.1 unnamed protein product [Rotaria sp. Silwood1]CAF1461507.1 unnamed protein product [Rotaria sp. Silwood1]CAF3447789.1 unnamed protein product [Rotaria sp. Silwood1]CAF3532984.1 unnamed protein product [Rotaria sp. Silwood1]